MNTYEQALAELGGVFARLDDAAVDTLIERIAQARLNDLNDPTSDERRVTIYEHTK